MERKGNVLMEKYELGKLLGQGTFAKVHHARNLETGASVAIKIIDKDKVFKVGLSEQIKREISVMRLVRHPNIVQLYEVMATKTKIYFVMEYVRGGELFKRVSKGKLKKDVARKYLQQLISAVDFCHARGIYHRDLKPENILLDEDGNLKVSDFGLSALSESRRQDGLLHTACGTPAYVAPEVINRRGYDGVKSDIWSCGVILFVLLAGYLPFRDPNLMEMYRKIAKGEFKFPNWFPLEARKLVSKILDPNPNTRISIDKIMENSWFSKGFKLKQRRVDIKEAMQESNRPSNLNAFDIISLSAGFDLSGLFEENAAKKEVWFTSRESFKTIISKLEDMARVLKMKVVKKSGGLMKLEGLEEGLWGGVLSIDVEIFEVTSGFYLVEVKKNDGDMVKYLKIMKETVRPALKDIVWAWHGDQQQTQNQTEDVRVSSVNLEHNG